MPWKNHINTGVSFFVFILYWNNWNIFFKLLSSYLTKHTFPSFLRTFPRLEWFLNLGRKVEIFFISKCFLFCFVKHFLHLTVYIKYKFGICGGGIYPWPCRISWTYMWESGWLPPASISSNIIYLILKIRIPWQQNKNRGNINFPLYPPPPPPSPLLEY